MQGKLSESFTNPSSMIFWCLKAIEIIYKKIPYEFEKKIMSEMQNRLSIVVSEMQNKKFLLSHRNS